MKMQFNAKHIMQTHYTVLAPLMADAWAASTNQLLKSDVEFQTYLLGTYYVEFDVKWSKFSC